MKKDRDCGMPYPIYPPYQGMGMIPPMTIPYQAGPMMNYPTITTSTNTTSNTTNNLEQQINNLDRRISNLENMYNTSNNKYSSSNFQMM